MNNNCLKKCKFKAICNLDKEKTARCKVADDPWVKHDEHSFFGASNILEKAGCKLHSFCAMD